MSVSGTATLPPRIELIIREVAHKHSVAYRDMVGPERTKPVARARFEAMWRVHNEIRIMGGHPSLPQIGRWFGNRDHTTVLNALRRHKELNSIGGQTRPCLPPKGMAQPAPHRLQMMADLAEASA